MNELMHVMADGAPAPVAPFSHAVRAGRFLFVTGQMPTRPGGGKEAVPGGIEAETRQVMENLREVLAAVGADFRHVTMARVYLKEFERDLKPMNAIYESYFEPGKLPARTCIGVTGLAVGALVEIDLVALLPEAA
jgi:reactive intermediate/imine deaminase